MPAVVHASFWHLAELTSRKWFKSPFLPFIYTLNFLSFKWAKDLQLVVLLKCAQHGDECISGITTVK